MVQDFFRNIVCKGLIPYLENNCDFHNLSLDKLSLKFKNYGDRFLYFKEVRFSIEDNLLKEYNIDFYKLPKLKYESEIESLGKQVISKDMFLHEFIRMLKYEQINFLTINTQDRDYFIIQTELKVNIYFDLEDGKLFRIGKLITGPYANA